MTPLRVKNRAESQHYRERRPPCIELHRGWLGDLAWHGLPDVAKASDGDVERGCGNRSAGGANCKVPPELVPHWRAYLRELGALT